MSTQRILQDDVTLHHVSSDGTPCRPQISAWSPQLAYYTGYTIDDMSEIANQIMSSATHVLKKVIAGFVAESSGTSRPDQHVGSFQKRYGKEFLERINSGLHICLALHGLDKSTNKQLSHVPSNSAPAGTGAGTGLGVWAEGGAALATGAETLGGLGGPVTVVQAA